MIRLASEVTPRSEQAPATGMAAGTGTPGEADSRLLRMRQARSRPWPFRSMVMAEPLAPAGTNPGADPALAVSSAALLTAATLPPGFSA